MVAPKQGDLHRPFQPLSLPLFQAESTLTFNHEIRLGQAALPTSSCCVAKPGPGLSPRCLTAVSWALQQIRRKKENSYLLGTRTTWHN